MKTVLALSLLAIVLGFTACKSSAVSQQSPQVVQISVTEDGYVPATVKVASGRPVKLVVTRKTDRTCAKEIVMKEYGINQPLPLNQAVEVTFTPTKSGTIQYACGMNMIKGTVEVQ